MTCKMKLLVFLLSVAVVGILTFYFRSSPATQTSAPSLIKDNLLFMRHIEPFLSAKTNLSVETFTWWRAIQFELRDLGYFNLTQKRLFEIFPSIPIFGKPTADRVRSCAVVGNSMNLKGSGYGRLIDSHEAIIRMNFGPVNGYEEDVGTKTTHHAMYPESAMDLDNSTHLVPFPFKINDIEWIIKAFTTGFYGRSMCLVLEQTIRGAGGITGKRFKTKTSKPDLTLEPTSIKSFRGWLMGKQPNSIKARELFVLDFRGQD